MVVLGIVGLPGSGKSTVASVFASEGWGIISMGDVVRQVAMELGLGTSAERLGELALRLRRERGGTFIAERCVEKARAGQGCCKVIEGLRTLEELSFFQRKFRGFVLLAVTAPDEERFRNLRLRAREDDPKAFADFKVRDRREERLGVSDVIRRADCVIANDSDLGALKKAAKELVQRLEHCAREG